MVSLDGPPLSSEVLCKQPSPCGLPTGGEREYFKFGTENPCLPVIASPPRRPRHGLRLGGLWSGSLGGGRMRDSGSASSVTAGRVCRAYCFGLPRAQVDHFACCLCLRRLDASSRIYTRKSYRTSSSVRPMTCPRQCMPRALGTSHEPTPERFVASDWPADLRVWG
ncbi:hypothetical protein JMJ77_0000587 [Colletotrichum scovillei]|uniref:Uncharacterized protein n=1 Tax=Colletotrichum scovillei TaxID=1209932 RepID=A0A9P7UEC0_9PEZI|nr:hypothetical protein JMJ77_0000587 [Colletotrichum scovillei]KAG7071795.1 hypothetical protein JMJ76_0004663 [Colletotrichum scovillei]KAG7080044.1 hypothetical protein JMJ78_0007146 [Colletotrichum scovillei]